MNATQKRKALEFDKRYMLDKTNISVIYSDSHVSLEGDYYVMLFNQGYHSLLEKLPGRLVKFFIDLSFDVMKDSGNLVKVNVEFYCEKYRVDKVSMYQCMHLLKKNDLLRKVRGMSKVYALNPKVCWRRSLKERKAAIEKWDTALASQSNVPNTVQQDTSELLLAGYLLDRCTAEDQSGSLS